MELNNPELNIEPIKSTTPIPKNEVSPEITRIGDNIRRLAEVKMATPSFRTQSVGSNKLNNILRANKSDKIKLREYDVGKEAFVQLSDGTLTPRFNSYIPGINNEEFLANRQSTAQKWGNGLQKFVGKTAVNVLGGTIGMVNGVLNGIKEGSFSAVYNNDFNDYLDDLNTKMDYGLANYYTEQEKNMNFGQKLTTANFWANDFLGGVSFLTGTIISEGLWAAATGGGSLIAKGATGGLTRLLTKGMTSSKSMAALNAVKAPGKNMIRAGAQPTKEFFQAARRANKIVKGANTARFLVTSAGFEAGVEARHYMNETKAEWEEMFLRQNGRKPTASEIGAFESSLTNSANTLFAANVGLVGTSNLTVLGKLFFSKALSKNISNNLFKKTFLGLGYKKTKSGGIEAITRNKYQKAFGKAYGIGKPVFTEGFVEEGGQSVFSTAANKYVLSAYDKDNIHDSLSLIDALKEGFEEAYTTKEGLTEVGLGALIGFLGGGISSKFKFNEVGQEAEQIEETAKFVNGFTRDNLIENLKASARIRQSTLDSEKAKSEGNLTEETISDKSAIVALTERAYHYENLDETIKDFNTAIDVMEDSKLEEELGLNKEEIQEWKADKKAQFKRVAEAHTQNLQFAEGIIGNAPIAGLEELPGLSKEGMSGLKSAIAYTLTMATETDGFSSDLANQIKTNIARELSLDDSVDAVTVNEVLRKVDSDKKQAFDEKSKQVKVANKKLNDLTKAIVKEDNVGQLIQDPEAKRKHAKKVAEKREALTELQEQVAQLELEKNLAFDALNIPQISDEIITPDMLEEQEQKVKKLGETIDKISSTDPNRGALLKKLTLEYERATTNAKNFDKLVKALLNDKSQVNVLNGWLSKIISKNKKLSGDIADLFTEAVQNYQAELGASGNLFFEKVDVALRQEYIDKIKAANPNVNLTELNKKTIKELAEELNEITKESKDPLEIPPEDPTQVTPTEVTPNRNYREIAKQKVKELKAKLQDIINRNPYLNLEYRGAEVNFDEIAPTQEDLDRYNELLKKSTAKYMSTVLTRPFRPDNPRGLTKEETEELQSLNIKLNNWKILLGLEVEGEGSITEVMQLINQLESEYELDKVKTETTAREIPSSKEADSSLGKDALNTVVTVDIPVAKKLGNTNKYEISHLEPLSLLRLFPGSKLYVLQKGKNTDITSIPKDKLEDLQKKPGTQFILTTEGGKDIAFKLVDRQRLEVDIESLESELSSSSIRILNFGNSQFMPLFVKAGDEFVPLQGDFKIESVNENEIISLDGDYLYSLKEGDNLRTVINLNDKFNVKLLKEYKKGLITKEELINNFHIYLSPQGSANKIVGSMRAILPNSTLNSNTLHKLQLIRKYAVEKALNSQSKRVEVGITIPIKMVRVGSPNISVEEQGGKLIPKGMILSPEALDMIEDYGYVEDGKFYTNKKGGENLEFSKEDTIFARRLSEREGNRGKKIPVIVFKYKGKTIVYPVSIRPNNQSRAGEVLDILNNSNLSDNAKIVQLNEVLLKYNLDPKKFAITSLQDRAVQDVITIFSRNESSKERELTYDVRFEGGSTFEDWLDKNHNKTQLLNEVELSVDITDKPFNAPKGILDFQGIQMPDENSMEIESVNTLDNLAKKVNSIFGQNNPFAEMTDNWKFYDAFEEEGIDRNAENYIMKKRNANILKNAFDQPIPKTVRSVLGDDLINQIRAELNQYKLLTQGSKLNTKVIEGELKDELSEIENNCK